MNTFQAGLHQTFKATTSKLTRILKQTCRLVDLQCQTKTENFFDSLFCGSVVEFKAKKFQNLEYPQACRLFVSVELIHFYH